MNDIQWQNLQKIIQGELLDPLPVGFIIDSPWLSGWGGMSAIDYFTDDAAWLATNFRAIQQFPGALMLPGFWVEYGMCTEPSAFGAKCIWPEKEWPFPVKVLSDYADIAKLTKPNCRSDGMCPFVIKRMQHCQKQVEAAGHAYRFATARGPMNIATFLLGHTETLVGLRTNPEEVLKLLEIITDFLVDWIAYQVEVFPSIDGILILDDLIGFVGEKDFRTFVVPFFKRIFSTAKVSVRFLHNDCFGLVNARYLDELGVNLFNFSFEHSLPQMRQAAGESAVLLGNIPPRDVLARGTPADVARAVTDARNSLADKRRLILSCGGGTPPGVPSANIEAFCSAAWS